MSRNCDALLLPQDMPCGDEALDRLLQPWRFYRGPDEVLTDSALSPSEKRAVLCSWASDACAVESLPALRRSADGSPAVAFDDIMEALAELDRCHEASAGSSNPERGDRSMGGEAGW